MRKLVVVALIIITGLAWVPQEKKQTKPGSQTKPSSTGKTKACHTAKHTSCG